MPSVETAAAVNQVYTDAGVFGLRVAGPSVAVWNSYMQAIRIVWFIDFWIAKSIGTNEWWGIREGIEYIEYINPTEFGEIGWQIGGICEDCMFK